MQSPMQHQNLQVYNWKNGGLKQLIGVCYGEISQLDQGDYHLFHYSLVYTEDLHAKKKLWPLFMDGIQPSHGYRTTTRT